MELRHGFNLALRDFVRVTELHLTRAALGCVWRRARERSGVEVLDLVHALRELPAIRGALVAVVVHGAACHCFGGGAATRNPLCDSLA
jgi:hypothetical protein